MLHALFSLLMAAIPSLLYIRYFYLQDRDRSRHRPVIIKVFLLGLAYTLPVYLFETFIGQIADRSKGPLLLRHFFDAFIVAGLCEEYIKFRIIKKFVFQGSSFKSSTDGIIYTIAASLGFACMENVMYVIDYSWHVALARGFTAVPMHAVVSGLMGYYLGKAKACVDEAGRERLLNTGLWLAIFWHGMYDLILFISPVRGFQVSVLVIPIILGIYFWIRHKIQQDQKGGLL